MQKSKHVCKLISSGKTNNYCYIIMSLLGTELGDLRRMLPERKMSLSTTLPIGIQCCQAIQDMHVSFFIHRDIKPSNFAIGAEAFKSTFYIFDFGLARQIISVEKDETAKEEESGHLKEIVTDKQLFKDCPKSFIEINGILKKLTYFDRPDYEYMRAIFLKNLVEGKGKSTDPFDWEIIATKNVVKGHNQKKDERVEADGRKEQDKYGEIEESVQSHESQSEDIGGRNCDREDILDNVLEMNK
uniref:Protein kinase domain-containing protein n=1 Tax=Rhabditophanes sp. KR3021 TaxID=114890 RepID=A0AC35TQG8_9BILA